MAKQFNFSNRGGMGVHPGTYVKGFDIVMRNLNKEITALKHRSERGLVLAAALVRRSTEIKPPLTPVDIGNLRASWFVVSPSGVEADPLGYSGQFSRGPGLSGKIETRIAEMASNHAKAISEAQGLVLSSSRRNPFVVMGYSMIYAAAVHEMMERHPDVTWNREGAGPKWFQAAVYGNRKEIVDIIATKSRIR